MLTNNSIAVAPASPSHRHAPGLRAVSVGASSLTEIHATVTPLPGELPAAFCQRLAAAVQHHGATVVRLIAFGSLAAAPAIMEQLRRALGDPDLPITWVEGAACDGQPLAGAQVHAIAGARIQRLSRGPLQARVWQDDFARHCVLANIIPTRTHGSRAEQTGETFEILQAGLATAGMGMNHLARTWFFLDDILAWYGEFNEVRNDRFARSELRRGSVPASTGVGGRNPAGAAVALVAWAVEPLRTGVPVVQMLGSPKQCPAPSYGSAFSRAVEISGAGARRVLVSGTASIEPGGATVHVGDAAAQIELTMEVIEAILTSRGMTFEDVSRATAYYRSTAFAPLFANWLERRELRHMPVVHAACDICRDDLLFELELDALRASA